MAIPPAGDVHIAATILWSTRFARIRACRDASKQKTSDGRKQAENKRWEPLITRSDDVYIVGKQVCTLRGYGINLLPCGLPRHEYTFITILACMYLSPSPFIKPALK